MGRVRLTETAKADLQDAIDHWNRTTKGQFTTRNVGIIIRDLKKLAETPLLDRKDIQLQGLCWY